MIGWFPYIGSLDYRGRVCMRSCVCVLFFATADLTVVKLHAMLTYCTLYTLFSIFAERCGEKPIIVAPRACPLYFVVPSF